MPRQIQISDSAADLSASILPSAAQDFLGELHTRFNPRRIELLRSRQQRQAAVNAGSESFDFLADTVAVRNGDWRVAAIPTEMQDRRVEITGPVDRKMMINALNSGAKVFMADFEDAHSPAWRQSLEGQQNVNDYYQGRLEFTNPDGKHYQVQEQHALLMLRVRGWHLPEKNFSIDGEAISGALFDFGLLLFHNYQLSADSGRPLYLYLPKMESHLEARLWNEVFQFAEQYLAMQKGRLRCTALIETLPAVFEMDEILYELRDYIAGLNCGRWDYIFSYIKSFQADASKVLPDRNLVGMQQPFLRAYSQLLVQTCHRRGAFAMGGMAAQIPIKNDAEANDQAFAKVRADKELEADNGHDGTWVAHPGLVPVALEVFERKLGGKQSQFDNSPATQITAADLLTPCSGAITEAGLSNNVNAALRYTYAWLEGSGAVPINNLMEDVATAEISRSQLWQWLHHGAQLDDGRTIDTALFEHHLQQKHEQIAQELSASNATNSSNTNNSTSTNSNTSASNNTSLDHATTILRQIVLTPHFTDFLTTPAYQHLT